MQLLNALCKIQRLFDLRHPVHTRGAYSIPVSLAMGEHFVRPEICRPAIVLSTQTVYA
jgi:hypothetical protein